MRLRPRSLRLLCTRPPIHVLAVILTAGAVVGLGMMGDSPVPLVGANAGAAFATAGPAEIEPGGAAPAHTATGASSSFTISGSVSGLYPGASLPLVLTITDPKTYAINVSSISTTVTSQKSSCSPVNVAVSSFAGSLAVPARSSVHTTVIAEMLQAAPDACQGVMFKLVYSGSGTAA